ncbi:MAG TPA: M20/M25/M40 family metallo-hydrolase, partial [Vicinamibacteria bacterium]|nr:M20/M25/M40 family metallo-hydrolase [Vicinamibacteria bacterium]
MTARTTQLMAWAREQQAAMESLLRELVEIESPSSDADGVARLARRLADELRACGLDPALVPVNGAGPLLTASGGGAGAPVMLLGHLDTVWPLGTLRTRPLRRQGDALYGPGTFDMKGGLVVALFALRALLAAGQRPSVLFFLTPLEEVGADAYRARMEEAMRGSAAVLGFE